MTRPLLHVKDLSVIFPITPKGAWPWTPPLELKAVKEAYAGQDIPTVGSTKSLSGHSLGAAGVQEAIYSLLMMEGDFIAASANIETLDPEADGMPIALERVDNAGLHRVMSNSFGFGGTNASLVFQRFS